MDYDFNETGLNKRLVGVGTGTVNGIGTAIGIGTSFGIGTGIGIEMALESKFSSSCSASFLALGSGSCSGCALVVLWLVSGLVLARSARVVSRVGLVCRLVVLDVGSFRVGFMALGSLALVSQWGSIALGLSGPRVSVGLDCPGAQWPLCRSGARWPSCACPSRWRRRKGGPSWRSRRPRTARLHGVAVRPGLVLMRTGSREEEDRVWWRRRRGDRRRGWC